MKFPLFVCCALAFQAFGPGALAQPRASRSSTLQRVRESVTRHAGIRPAVREGTQTAHSLAHRGTTLSARAELRRTREIPRLGLRERITIRRAENAVSTRERSGASEIQHLERDAQPGQLSETAQSLVRRNALRTGQSPSIGAGGRAAERWLLQRVLATGERELQTLSNRTNLRDAVEALRVLEQQRSLTRLDRFRVRSFEDRASRMLLEHAIRSLESLGDRSVFGPSADLAWHDAMDGIELAQQILSARTDFAQREPRLVLAQRLAAEIRARIDRGPWQSDF